MGKVEAGNFFHGYSSVVSTPALACWCKCTADEHRLLNQRTIYEVTPQDSVSSSTYLLNASHPTRAEWQRPQAIR